MNNSNLNESKIINELKEELNKSKKIIEQQKLKINKLQNQLHSSKIKLNKLQSLKTLISQKDKELNNLKLQLININNNINLNNSNNKINDKCVNFISNDENIKFAIPCSGDSLFAEIEEKLYKKFPDYRETKNTFLADGKEVLRFKTINENKIGTGFPIILIKPE